MRLETYGVAPLMTATSDSQVVAGASGEATQLCLARRRRRLCVGVFDGQREADVSFDRLDPGAHRLARCNGSRAGNLLCEVFRSIQGGEQRASRIVNSKFAR